MEYTLVKNEGTYEVEIHLGVNEFDYPVACIRLTGWSNEFDSLKMKRYVETDINKEKMIEAIKGIISQFEERFKSYREAIESVDAWIKLGSI